MAEGMVAGSPLRFRRRQELRHSDGSCRWQRRRCIAGAAHLPRTGPKSNNPKPTSKLKPNPTPNANPNPGLDSTSNRVPFIQPSNQVLLLSKYWETQSALAQSDNAKVLFYPSKATVPLTFEGLREVLVNE